jgi:signal transduction histidine kinase
VLLERIRLLDSMYKINSAESIAELETKYNLQKKETTILQQKLSITNKNYIIYTIAGLGLLILVIVLMILKNRKDTQQQRIKEILIDNERKTSLAIDKAKEEERRRIIADLHDDVGGGLSTIRMISDLITGQTEHALKLEQYAVKISGITKDVTQRMNTIVWALNSENDTLQNLCEYIREYGFGFFENSSIKFSSNLVEASANVQLSGLQRKNLFLVVKECLNNVYKHSDAKNTWINIQFSDKLLSLEIHDDGKGITNEKTLGNGLKNIQKRMREINGEVIFKTNNGTSVLLKVFAGSTVFTANELNAVVN